VTKRGEEQKENHFLKTDVSLNNIISFIRKGTMTELFNQLGGRKFTLGIGNFVALMLTTTGTIDAGTEVQVANAIGMAISVIMIGLVDIVKATKSK